MDEIEDGFIRRKNEARQRINDIIEEMRIVRNQPWITQQIEVEHLRQLSIQLNRTWQELFAVERELRMYRASQVPAYVPASVPYAAPAPPPLAAG